MREPKPIVLRPVQPNAGLEAQYRAKLDRHIERMHASLVYWLTATYRANEPEIATDESPAMALRDMMRALTRRWTKEFDKIAREYGPRFVRSTASHTDKAFAAVLKKAGFTVPFKTTRAMNDVIQAAVGENVSLIKSIATEHLSDVEGLVLRSVQAGRDLGTLAKELEDRYAITQRRAALIARQQNNSATANINRARQVSLGITEAMWLHSSAGKTPRRSHLAANGKTFNVREGMWDADAKAFVLPGQLLNCRCRSRSIIRALG